MLPLESRAPLVELFQQHPAVHVYGLADLDQDYWNRSLWWMRGNAAVGLVGLPQNLPSIVYAVSVLDPAGSIALLADVDSQLPDHYIMTGPTGSASGLTSKRTALWSTPHLKMMAGEPAIGGIDQRVKPVPSSGVADYQDLLDSDPEAGDFFHAGLVDSTHYVAIWDDAQTSPTQKIVAGAGVHVWNDEFSVCAMGNVATRPSHRRQGLATACVASLTNQLRAQYTSVGLNVKCSNIAARGVYEQLGYRELIKYDEAELVRVSR